MGSTPSHRSSPSPDRLSDHFIPITRAVDVCNHSRFRISCRPGRWEWLASRPHQLRMRSPVLGVMFRAENCPAVRRNSNWPNVSERSYLFVFCALLIFIGRVNICTHTWSCWLWGVQHCVRRKLKFFQSVVRNQGRDAQFLADSACGVRLWWR